MNEAAVCRNELALRERRGELSPAERTAFGAHLASCEDCRLGRTLGRDFDESAVLEGGDGERIQALSTLARRWAGGAEPPALPAAKSRFHPRVLLLAAALPLLIAAGASAAFGVYRVRTAEVPSAPPASKTLPPRAPAPKALPMPAVTLTVEPAPAAPIAAARVVEKAPARTPASAAERFELANAARRSGDVTRAIQLFRELERDFPASAEAAASELRLGGLLLDRGKAGAALEQFDRHLRRSGALAPEALYGRGRALAALDEGTAERQTWTRMLRDFPSSPYAAHAQRRLVALDGSGAADAR